MLRIFYLKKSVSQEISYSKSVPKMYVFIIRIGRQPGIQRYDLIIHKLPFLKSEES